MTLDQFDSLYASMARPTGYYLGAAAVFACCFMHETAAMALPLAAGLAGTTAVLRTLDKKTIANAPKNGAAP